MKTFMVLKEFNIEKKIKISITKEDTYTLNLEKILDFVFKNDIGKIYKQKHYEKIVDE